MCYTAEQMDENLKKAHQLLDELCKVKMPSQHGGWSVVTDEDLKAIYKLFELIVRAKYEQDADGDVPLDIDVLDRTKYYPNHYWPIRYTHKIETEKEEEESLKDLIFNVKNATDALSKFIDIRNHRKWKEEQAKK